MLLWFSLRSKHCCLYNALANDSNVELLSLFYENEKEIAYFFIRKSSCNVFQIVYLVSSNFHETYPLVETSYEIKCLSNHTGTWVANVNTCNTARCKTSHLVQVLFTMLCFLLLLLIKVSIKHVVASAHAQLLPLVITVWNTFPLVITVANTFLPLITVGNRFPLVITVGNTFPPLTNVRNTFPLVITFGSREDDPAGYDCWESGRPSR